MKKLTLDVDALHVQSFSTDSDGIEEGGTIQAHQLCQTWGQPSCPSMAAATDCPQSYYGTCHTCGNSCGGGCTFTCPTNTPECYEDS